MSPRPCDGFARALLAWHHHSGRHDLPWQHPRTPYRVWLAEVMLQQTQVGTVIPYFERFVTDLPTLPDLAAAELDTVLALWSGLGYYARARNLHRAARLCVERHGGELPKDIEALQALPGIGRSTAGAILAQAHGQRHAILDGNVKRVLCRFHGIEGWPGSREVEQRLWPLAESHLPHERLAEYTQAQMDLGATVCTRADPSCMLCPLSTDCRARLDGRIDQLPTPRPGKALPQRQAIVMILRNGAGEVLLQRRPPTGVWAGLWSLPEALDHVEARVWLHRHSDRIFELGRSLAPVDHVFSHYRLRLQPRLWTDARLTGVHEDRQQRWLALDALESVGLPTPIKRLLAALAVDKTSG